MANRQAELAHDSSGMRPRIPRGFLPSRAILSKRREHSRHTYLSYFPRCVRQPITFYVLRTSWMIPGFMAASTRCYPTTARSECVFGAETCFGGENWSVSWRFHEVVRARQELARLNIRSRSSRRWIPQRNSDHRETEWFTKSLGNK